MVSVKRGDIVFHLCGESGEAAFCGFSVADENGQPVEHGPDGPESLYCVGLRGYSNFETPIKWDDIRKLRHGALVSYFEENKAKNAVEKERLFYVQQSGRLQCLNGAYLSFLSDQLIEILFGIHTSSTISEVSVRTTAAVGTTLRSAAVRVGQQKFAENVKANFAGTCCFPECPVSDPRFLVGAHIARWTDAAELRGLTENGLCLCVLHDRAFEIGAFVVDHNLNIRLHKSLPKDNWVRAHLAYGVGRRIRASTVIPTIEVLSHHWARHGFPSPLKQD
jgi:putative restriction endonuclease